MKHWNRLFTLVLLASATSLAVADDATPSPEGKAEKKEEKKKPSAPEMDELSKELMTNLSKIEYRWKNLKRIHATVSAKVAQNGAEQPATGKYTMTDGKSSLDYKGPASATLMQQGWGKDSYDAYWTDIWMAQFAGASLTAKKTETGATITVTGKCKSPIHRMEIDKRGLMVRGDMKMGPQDIAFQPTYTKLESGQFLMSGYKIELPTIKFVDVTKLIYKEQNGRRILVKAESAATLNGAPYGSKVLEFVWKFNDDAK